MKDRELNDLMADIADLAHDLEWSDSGDYGKDDYKKSVAKFKRKWFESDRNERLRDYVDKAINDLKEELHALIE